MHNSFTEALPHTDTTKGVSSHKSQPMRAVHGLLSLPSSLMSASRVGSSSKGSRQSIKFYNRDEPYYEFTNFYQAPVVIDDQCWPSTEHYFQAQKFVGTPYLEVIRRFPSAREAFQLSRNPTVSRWRRSDWDAVKDDVMLKALRCKFAQYQDLREMLWKTEDRELIEHTTNDTYWADGGGHGRGQNKLGKLLMQVRSEVVAVRGPYKSSKESSDRSVSRAASTKLKRSSSLSDLSGHTAKKSNSVLESNDYLSSKLQGTTLGSSKTKPGLRRTSSFSRIPQFSDSTSSGGSYRDAVQGVLRRSHESPELSSATYLHPSSRSHLWSSSTQTSSKHSKSIKGATPNTFYGSSSSSVSISGSMYRRSRPEPRDPITGRRWY